MTKEELIFAGFGVGDGALRARAEVTLTVVNVQYYRLTIKLAQGGTISCVAHASAFREVEEATP